MGGSSLGPEVIRRTFGDCGRAAAARARLHRPRRRARAREARRPREDAVHRLLEVRRDDRDAVAHALLLRAHRRRRVAVRRGHRSRQPAGGARRRSAASGACSRTTRTSAAATRCCRTSGSCRPRCAGVDIEALLERRPGGRAELCSSTTPQSTPGSGWAGDGRAALQGRDKLTFVVSEPIVELWPVGRAADRRVHGQAGQGHPAGGRRAARRRPRPTATTACSCTCGTRTSPTRTLDAKIEALGRPGTRSLTLDVARRRRPRADLLLRRVRHRGGRLGARHQPVRPAERAGGQGQHGQGAGGGRAARREDPTMRSRAARRRRAAATTSPSWATSSRPRSSTRRSPSCAPRCASATKCTTTFGYGPRYLHSTGQYHKGGPANGLFIQLVPRRRRGRGDPRGGLLVRAPEERAGARRHADPARAWPARSCESRIDGPGRP